MRKSNDQNGFVNFPTQDESYRDSKQGGMFVMLTVCEKDKAWPTCIINHVSVWMDESFVGDDVSPPNQYWEVPVSHEEFEEWNKPESWARRLPAENFHFPYLRMKKHPQMSRQFGKAYKYISIEYLAAIVIGTTGWSGWNEEKKEYWKCSYDDLNPAGQDLYQSIEELYGPDCQIYLQTWLDT